MALLSPACYPILRKKGNRPIDQVFSLSFSQHVVKWGLDIMFIVWVFIYHEIIAMTDICETFFNCRMESSIYGESNKRLNLYIVYCSHYKARGDT